LRRLNRDDEGDWTTMMKIGRRSLLEKVGCRRLAAESWEEKLAGVD
jgi:hypothetical protein